MKAPLRPFTMTLAQALIGLALATTAVQSPAADWHISSGLDFSNGDYGNAQATKVWYVPLTLKYEGARSTFKMTLPWLSIDSPTGGNIIDVDADGRPIYDGAGPRVTESGWGDAVIAYSWSVWPAPQAGFLLDLGGKVKLPTASESKGLGSGRADYALNLDLYYLAGAVTPFASLGYRVPGDPDGLELDNQWFGTVGVGYKFSNANSAGLMFDLRQASTDSAEASREATLYWVHRFATDFKVQAYGVKGFSEASADWGLGLMGTWSF